MSDAYDADPHVAEIYDQEQSSLQDLAFLRGLIANLGRLRILEPFCGTGRLLVPLALDGHHVVGMDRSEGMLSRAHHKIRNLPLEAQARIELIQADVLSGAWPASFDLVLLGCNCFYELAAPDEQEQCIQQASRALHPHGYLFIDNNHMEGELAAAWRNIGCVEPSLQGRCTDGTMVESTRETIWFDAPRRLARFRRRTKVTAPDGRILEKEFVQQKHPVSKDEVQGWLEKHGFAILGIYGSYAGEPYMDTLPRAIFWARRI